MNTLVLLSIAVLIYLWCSARELKLIQVVFRHGDRAPSLHERFYYLSDPNVNKTWYPEGWGGLNNGGKRRAYELGVFLRDRYGKFLGDVYLEETAVFRSSTVPIAIMAAQLLAAGLFPPKKIQRWSSEIDWQPIPVFSKPFKTETVFLARSSENS